MEGAGMLTSDSLLRSWNWRYLLARERVRKGLGFSRRQLDAWTIALVRYLRRRKACRTAADRQALARSFPAFDAAMGVYCAADRRIRYVLEARVLAGEALESIAAGLGTTVNVVAAYVAAFFDVGPQLECADLIVARLFAASSNRPYDFFDQGLKIVGYVGGSQSLSAVLGTLRSESPDRLKTLQQEASRLNIVGRAYEDLVTAGKLTPRQLRDFLPLLKDRDIVGEPVNEYAANVQQMLMGMPLVIMDREDARRFQKREGMLEARAYERTAPKQFDEEIRKRLEDRNPPKVRPPRHVAEEDDAQLIARAEPPVREPREEDQFS
jgi:hypothetical protein